MYCFNKKGIFSRKVGATRGITAGAGFAALELRRLFLDLIVILQKKCGPELVIKLYVDDLRPALRSNPAELIRLMVMVVNFVVYFLEVVLRMQVSKKKSNVVASTPSVAVAIALEVTNAAVKPAFHAKLLCSDLVGGAKRSTQQHQTRLVAFRCMRPQFLALRNAGADVQQMARAAGAPMFLYSNENYGLSETALHSSITVVAA